MDVHPIKNGIIIGIDPYPYPFTSYFDVHQGYKVLTHCHIATSNDQITTDTPYAALRWMALRGSLLGFDTTRMLRITGAPWAVTMAHWGLVVYHIKLYGKYKMKFFWRLPDGIFWRFFWCILLPDTTSHLLTRRERIACPSNILPYGQLWSFRFLSFETSD